MKKKKIVSAWTFTLVSLLMLIINTRKVHAMENKQPTEPEAIIEVVDGEKYTFIAVIIGIVVIVALIFGVKHFILKIKDMHIDSGDNDSQYHKSNMIVIKILSMISVLFILIISCEFLLRLTAINLIAY